MIITALLAIAASILIVFTITPVVRVLAFKIGAVDVPTDDRRMHKIPIPRLGGLGMFIAFFISTLCFCEINDALISIWIGGAILVILGVIDDIFRLKAWVKLIFQIVAACIPLIFDVSINCIWFGETCVQFGPWKYFITILWIVALTNAINLIDGLDGLACGVSAISSISLLCVQVLMGETTTAILTGVLAGACLGFLPYNKNPAKIFMGDTGALFLGYTMSIISIQGTSKLHTLLSFALPLIIFALPIFDTLLAVIRRILKRQSPFKADRHHVHHMLIDLGLNQKESVIILYAISALLGLVAITFTDALSVSTSKWMRAIIILVVAIGIFVLNFIVLRKPELRSKTGFVENKTENVNQELKDSNDK